MFTYFLFAAIDHLVLHPQSLRGQYSTKHSRDGDSGVQNLCYMDRLTSMSSESCKNIDDCRTLVGIIWSCIATLVACTWVSVHPNVPSPHHGTVVLILLRMRLMLLAIIAPEVIVIWALRQRMVAHDLSKSTRPNSC